MRWLISSFRGGRAWGSEMKRLAHILVLYTAFHCVPCSPSPWRLVFATCLVFTLISCDFNTAAAGIQARCTRSHCRWSWERVRHSLPLAPRSAVASGTATDARPLRFTRINTACAVQRDAGKGCFLTGCSFCYCYWSTFIAAASVGCLRKTQYINNRKTRGSTWQSSY